MDSLLDRGFRHRKRSGFQRRGLIPLNLPVPVVGPILSPLIGAPQSTPPPASNPPANTPGTTTPSTPANQPNSGPSPSPQTSPGVGSPGGVPTNPSSPSQAGQKSPAPGKKTPPGRSGNNNPSSSQSAPNSNNTTGLGASTATSNPASNVTPVIANNLAQSSNGAPAVQYGTSIGSSGPSSHVTTPVGLGSSYPSSGVTVINGSGYGGNGGGGGGSSTANSASSKQGISSGAIAGIIVSLCLVLIGALLFFIRRRHKARQNARREAWMKYRNEALHGTGSPSTRSSFASPGVSGEEFSSHFYTSSVYSVSGGQVQASPPQIAELSLPPVAVIIEHVGGSNSRGSVYSVGSDSSSSDGHGQFITVPETPTDSPLRSPMSVRPFTPSESWAFPKPPLPSSTTPPPTSMQDPFTELSGIETIKRPFAPTMHDELSVVPGDRIRILNTYDDGWAMVEKIDVASDKAIGLIPIDCLRSTGEELSTFITSKRLSSYGNMADAPRAV